jgi:hypothetical protein
MTLNYGGLKKLLWYLERKKIEFINILLNYIYTKMYIINNTDIDGYNPDQSLIEEFWLKNNIINSVNVIKRDNKIISKRIHINSYELYDEYNNNPITLSEKKKINSNLTYIRSVENNDNKYNRNNQKVDKDNSTTKIRESTNRKTTTSNRIPCKKITCTY